MNSQLCWLSFNNNNNASKSLSLNAPFWSRKICILSAYKENYYTTIKTYFVYTVHARLTKLCLLDRSNGYLALLVEFDTKLHKSPYLEKLPFGHAKSVSLQHKTKLLYTNYFDYIACLTELCLLDREKGFGSLAEPIGFWMLVGW